MLKAMTKIRYFDDPTEIEVMPLKRQQSNRTHTIGLLLGAATVILSIEISIHRLIFSSLVLLTAIALAKPFAKQSIAFPKQSNAVLTKFDTLQRKLGIKLYGLAFTLLCTIFLLDLTTAPAQAQFLNNAQQWMQGAFPNIDATIVELVFNVLRALFLLYLAISLVRIINAARQDEDWQQLARTPLIILITVVMGDILTGFIVGT
ncbi:MAG TPA: hypothetical protein DD990_16010, partial [Cyanobacteria bacterium UBA11368]|nr:hypothetical protein [Cyanobacteria bacterium UBA11368]